MDSCVQFFRLDRKLSGCAVGEPSVTLIENDLAFGVLLAEGIHQDSTTSRLYLDQATYLRVRKARWQYDDFQTVCIYCMNGVWVAQDVISGRFFHEASVVPYHIIFVSEPEYRGLMVARHKDMARPIFHFAQMRFGRLPGFTFEKNMLTTPDTYASRKDLFQADEYVTRK